MAARTFFSPIGSPEEHKQAIIKTLNKAAPFFDLYPVPDDISSDEVYTLLNTYLQAAKKQTSKPDSTIPARSFKVKLAQAFQAFLDGFGEDENSPNFILGKASQLLKTEIQSKDDKLAQAFRELGKSPDFYMEKVEQLLKAHFPSDLEVLKMASPQQINKILEKSLNPILQKHQSQVQELAKLLQDKVIPLLVLDAPWALNTTTITFDKLKDTLIILLRKAREEVTNFLKFLASRDKKYQKSSDETLSLFFTEGNFGTEINNFTGFENDTQRMAFAFLAAFAKQDLLEVELGIARLEHQLFLLEELKPAPRSSVTP